MSYCLAVMEAAVGFSSYGMRDVIVKESRLSACTGLTQHHVTKTL